MGKKWWKMIISFQLKPCLCHHPPYESVSLPQFRPPSATCTASSFTFELPVVAHGVGQLLHRPVPTSRAGPAPAGPAAQACVLWAL